MNWPRRCSSSLGVPSGLRALISFGGGGSLGLTDTFFRPSLDLERRRFLDSDLEGERRLGRLSERELDLRFGSLRFFLERSRDDCEEPESLEDAEDERCGLRFLRRGGGGGGDLSLDFEPDLADLSLDTEPLLA